MQDPPKAGDLSLVLSIVVIQLIDIAIHVATGQVELIRILSNLTVGGWALWSLRAGARIRAAGPEALVVYVGLTLAFLTMSGLTNPDKGGAPRLPLFVLVGLTTVLVLRAVSRRRGGFGGLKHHGTRRPMARGGRPLRRRSRRAQPLACAPAWAVGLPAAGPT